MANPRVFISYSRKDSEPVDYLVDKLVKLDLNVFVDTQGIRGGDDFSEIILDQIDQSDVVIFVISKNSYNSIWVEKEIKRAFAQRKRIIPLRIDNAPISKPLTLLVEGIQQDFLVTTPEFATKLAEVIKKETETIEDSRRNALSPEATGKFANKTRRSAHSSYKSVVIQQLEAAGIDVTFSGTRNVHFYAVDPQGHPVPIIIHGNADSGFTLFREYADIQNVVIVYVWGIPGRSEILTHAMTYEEAYKFARDLEGDDPFRYRQEVKKSRLQPEIKSHLKKYQMTPEKWRMKLEKIATSSQETSSEGEAQHNYFTSHREDAVKRFMLHVNELERLASKKQWSVKPKFNKHWCSFKHGHLNVFGIAWGKQDSIILFVKISPEEMRAAGIGGAEYKDVWNEAYYTLPAGIQLPDKYLPVLEMAYKNVVG